MTYPTLPISQSLTKPRKALGPAPLGMNGGLCYPLNSLNRAPSFYTTPQTKAEAKRGQKCSYFKKLTATTGAEKKSLLLTAQQRTSTCNQTNTESQPLELKDFCNN